VDRQRGDLPAAATANWVSNLAVAQSFLSLTQATIGPAWTFLILGALSVAAVVRLRAGDQGALPIEEVEKMLDARHPRRRKGIECFWVISEIVGTSRLKLNTYCKSFLVSCQFFYCTVGHSRMAPTHLPCAPNPAVSRRPDGSPRALLSLLTSSSLQPASIPADTSSLPMATSEELAQIDISKEVLLRTYSLPPAPARTRHARRFA
jgi:hypothetical protein